MSCISVIASVLLFLSKFKPSLSLLPDLIDSAVSTEQTDPQVLGLLGSGDFYRFEVTFQGATEDETSCPAPDPLVQINCPATLRIVEQLLGTECALEGNTVTCRGNGQVILDCYSTSTAQDSLILGPLGVRMPSPDPFFCEEANNVGQAFIIGSICPDNTKDQSDRTTCSPLDTTGFLSGTTLCFRECSGGCSEQDLAEMSGEALGTCRWDQDQTASPVSPTTQPPVTLPTLAPVVSPTEPPVTPPTQAPVPPPTEPPVNPPSPIPTQPPQDPPTDTPTLPTPRPSVAPANPPSDSGGPTPCVNVMVDFSKDANDNDLQAGAYVDNEWEAFGLVLSSSGGFGSLPRLFDTSNASNNASDGDSDLGSPNSMCTPSGPGVGKGGLPGSAGENCEPLGNVLIIQEDNSETNIPDDNASGGTIVFDFVVEAVSVNEIGILDLDEPTVVTVVHLTNLGMEETVIDLPRLGQNSAHTETINIEMVSQVRVDFAGSGAVTSISFCHNA